MYTPVQGWPIVLGAYIENPNPITVDDLTGTALVAPAVAAYSTSAADDSAERVQREKQAAERAERERHEKQAAERAEREREIAERAEREREAAAQAERERRERDQREEADRQASYQRDQDEQRRRQESETLAEEARQAAIEAERLLEAKRALETHSAHQHGIEPVNDAEAAWYADQESKRQTELSDVNSKLDAARYRVNMVC